MNPIGCVLVFALGASGCGGGEAPSDGWLSTADNHIVRSDGSVWVGRGANLHDTRSCGAGTGGDDAPLHDDAAGVDEVKRRVDTLTDDWHATFIRLVLESRRDDDTYAADSTYRATIRDIVDHIGTKPDVYVLISVWYDPTFDAHGWPTDATNDTLAQLARDFFADDFVLFGVSNEPEENFDGALDAQAWDRMDAAVATIRAAEAALGDDRHIVTVQGTRDWGRDLSYYVAHPIEAGGGEDVAYETHVYNNPSEFAALLAPGADLPLIVGELGPIEDEFHVASVTDAAHLMDLASGASIPYLAWTFHQYCPPNLIASEADRTWDQSTTDTDGIGMALVPTDFGDALKADLSRSR